jgi:ribosome-associated translation inhibitor RaiA
MRIRFDTQQVTRTSRLVGAIAERLERLNAPYEDIYEARVTLLQRAPCLSSSYEMRVELLLAGRTLSVTQRGTTQRQTVNLALRELAHQLQCFRLLRPVAQTRPA